MSATVVGLGLAVGTGACELRSWSPSDRLSASDSTGQAWRSSLKSVRPMAMTSVARAARTEADRGESVSNDSSPSVPAAELADHGAGGLINDLESASADNVHRVGRLMLAEQPFPGVQVARM